MRSKRITFGLVALLVVAASLLSACGGASGEATNESVSIDGETLLQDRCTGCHGLDRVTEVQQTRQEWENTVTNMVNRGAELSEDEKTVLVDYLAQTYGP